jgi:iron complex outermembrane receptor protein
MRAPLGHLFLFGALLLPASLHAQDAADLKRLSIEELMLIDVTTAARRPEPVGSTAGAVTVVTSDDIRRSGVTTIADALRLVTGVHVAQTSGAVWNLTARGFNQATANKLLVMVDGRTVYSPLFTGVFWNVIDYVLEDIERIEVIRGPGATLWGANAVNGVINIITRHTRSTRGTYLMASAGTEDRANLTVRYGGGTGADDGFSWRVYGKVADSDAQAFASGLPSRDDRTRGQVGFRSRAMPFTVLMASSTAAAVHSPRSTSRARSPGRCPPVRRSACSRTTGAKCGGRKGSSRTTSTLAMSTRSMTYVSATGTRSSGAAACA